MFFWTADICEYRFEFRYIFLKYILHHLYVFKVVEEDLCVSFQMINGKFINGFDLLKHHVADYHESI